MEVVRGRKVVFHCGLPKVGIPDVIVTVGFELEDDAPPRVVRIAAVAAPATPTAITIASVLCRLIHILL